MIKKKFIGFNSFLAIFICALTLFACQTDKKEDQSTVNEKNISSKDSLHLKEDSSFAALNEKIRNDLSNPDLYYQRALSYAKDSIFELAVSDLNRAIKLDSTNRKYYLKKAQYQFGMGELIAEKNTLDKAVKIIPECDECYTMLGEIALMTGSFEKTIEFSNNALKINRYNAYAYALKGLAYLEMEDTTKSISSLQTAIEQNPKNFDVLMQLGVIYTAQKDDKALLYYERALKIKPKDKQALYNQALYYQMHSKYNKAIELYTSLTKLYPDFGEAFFNMGYINLVHLKTYEVATEYFSKAITASAGYYQAYYNRGYAYEKLGEKDKALKDYKKALSIHPQYTPAAKGVSRVGNAG